MLSHAHGIVVFFLCASLTSLQGPPGPAGRPGKRGALAFLRSIDLFCHHFFAPASLPLLPLHVPVPRRCYSTSAHLPHAVAVLQACPPSPSRDRPARPAPADLRVGTAVQVRARVGGGGGERERARERPVCARRIRLSDPAARMAETHPTCARPPPPQPSVAMRWEGAPTLVRPRRPPPPPRPCHPRGSPLAPSQAWQSGWHPRGGSLFRGCGSRRLALSRLLLTAARRTAADGGS